MIDLLPSFPNDVRTTDTKDNKVNPWTSHDCRRLKRMGLHTVSDGESTR